MNHYKDISYYKKISYDFNRLFEKTTQKNLKKLDWWVTSSANRNPFVSLSFKKYCELLYINNNKEFLKLETKKNSVNKSWFSYIFSGYKNISNYLNFNLKAIFLNYIIFLNEILKRLVQLLAARITKEKNLNYDLNTSIILIDIFAFPGYYTKDRYYDGLWDNLNNDEKSYTFFVPTLVNTSIKDYFQAYKTIRNTKRNILVKEDFLEISDITYALLHFIRLRFLKFSNVIEDGVDLSIPIKEEIKNNLGFSSAVEGILNYRFIMRLKKKGVKLKLVVDWWESQAVDKGLHLAMHHYFPDIPVIGYLGYAPRDLELQLYPTKNESNAHVIPKIIGVIGDGFVESIKRYYPEQMVVTVPAFRFQYLWEEKEFNKNSKPFILLALTVIRSESFNILKQVIKSLEIIKKYNLEILIKPHPTMTIEQLKKGLDEEWPNNFKFVDGLTKDYIRSSKILITGMSSIALESIALGIPVIITGQTEDSLPLIPIPDNVPKDMWNLCYNHFQLIEALENFMIKDFSERDKFIEKGKLVREKYFKPVTRESVIKFLDL